MIFQELWGVTQIDFWKTHPNMNEFTKIGPAHAPEIEISKKYWMSFPEIRLCHTLEN